VGANMKNKKTLLTGGNGMVGSAFVRSGNYFLTPSSKDLNLLDRKNVISFIKENNIEQVFHVAARVGGVKANTDYVADFYSENIRMNTNLIDACVLGGVEKLVCCLSTCVYPNENNVSWPITEEQLHNGEPHSSNFGYAYAKRMVDIQLRAVRQQYGLEYISVIPNNLYGEYDNFDLENSHVLPALMRKILEAKINNKTYFEVWGDGEVYREFTYSKDIAKIMLFCLENYNEPSPINIGNTQEYLLKDVVEMIKKELRYSGEIVYNTDKPKGQIRKPSSNKKLLQIGWKDSWYTPLEVGLKNTCGWFVKNYPNVRGI
jgi:GDP-L-fucose synthase